MKIYGVQIRAARAALGWPVAKTIKLGRVGIRTLQRLERAGEIKMVDVAKGRSAKGLFERARVEALVQLFEDYGVEFLPRRGGKGPGIRYNGNFEEVRDE